MTNTEQIGSNLGRPGFLRSVSSRFCPCPVLNPWKSTNSILEWGLKLVFVSGVEICQLLKDFKGWVAAHTACFVQCLVAFFCKRVYTVDPQNGQFVGTWWYSIRSWGVPTQSPPQVQTVLLQSPILDLQTESCFGWVQIQTIQPLTSISFSCGASAAMSDVTLTAFVLLCSPYPPNKSDPVDVYWTFSRGVMSIWKKMKRIALAHRM